MYYLGIDEAGYGPNLGPLVIAGSVWKSPQPDLYSCLAPAVSASPTDRGAIVVADSKSLHNSSAGLANLQRQLWPTLPMADAELGQVTWERWLTWFPLLQFPAPEGWEHQRQLFPAEGLNLDPSEDFLQAGLIPNLKQTLPLPLKPDEVAARQNMFQHLCRQREVQQVAIGGLAIFPEAFNRGLQAYGNKSSLLTVASLALGQWLLNQVPAGSTVYWVADKHGGRNSYGTWLQRILEPSELRCELESRALSRYHLIYRGRHVQADFAAGGERFLPTAWASMFAKYTREAVMECWNSYWCERIPGLRPTKGYPVDAARFWEEISATALRLGWATEQLWRAR